MGMVELFKLESEGDRRELRRLVQRHHQYTGSAVAERMLENWESALQRFVKVMPTEYRKVLEQMENDEEQQKLASV